jgi:hypothetical protein
VETFHIASECKTAVYFEMRCFTSQFVYRQLVSLLYNWRQTQIHNYWQRQIKTIWEFPWLSLIQYMVKSKSLKHCSLWIKKLLSGNNLRLLKSPNRYFTQIILEARTHMSHAYFYLELLISCSSFEIRQKFVV